MGYKSDIEIAQECEMLPITQIAEKAGIDDKYLEQYGKYKAKIDYNLLKESDKKDGKLILVTDDTEINISVSLTESGEVWRAPPFQLGTPQNAGYTIGP